MSAAAELIALCGRQDREARTAARAFADGLRDGDFEKVADAVDVIENGGSWRKAFAACARLSAVHPETPERFVSLWCRYGDRLRQDVGDDRLLFNALRVLFGPYTGPAVTLFRGETMRNRQRRAYGPSWTTDPVVAESHARNRACHPSGAVLLMTLAPPEAIIGAPALLTDEWSEQEYLVDRRELTAVTVVQRFP